MVRVRNGKWIQLWGGEPFGRKGERKAKYPPAQSHEAASKTVLRCRYGDFRLLDSDNDPPILNLKGHLNPTQFDGAREPISCLRVAGSLHHSFRDLRHALFSPEAICSIGSSILHEECRYFQSKLALRQNISLYGTCISEHNHFFGQKSPPRKISSVSGDFPYNPTRDACSLSGNRIPVFGRRGAPPRVRVPKVAGGPDLQIL